MKDLMIDIETLGNKSHSVILSLAAVEFDLDTGNTGKEFYKKIDLQSCLDAGLKINASTLQWWMEQKPEALKELFNGATPLEVVLSNFRDFYTLQCGTPFPRVWGNGARFDLGILEDAYEAIGQNVPWGFRSEMDVRTLVAFAPDIKKNLVFEGVAHNPLHDCYHQIKYCCETWKTLKHEERTA